MTGRGKKNPASFPGDFIALGSKATGGGSKRDGNMAGSQMNQPGPASSKKGGPSSNLGPGSSASHSARRPVGMVQERAVSNWEGVAEELSPNQDLVEHLEEAFKMNDMERSDALLAGAVKSLRKERAKPEQLTWISLMFAAKTMPGLFVNSEIVRTAFCSLLKRDIKESYKSKGNSVVPVTAANLLMCAFQDERHWPDLFVTVYIDDATGERVWVDHPECRLFCDNILTAFNTVLPPHVRNGFSLDGGGGGGHGACASPPAAGGSGGRTPTRPDDEVQVIELPINKEPVYDQGVTPRYSHLTETIERTVMATIKDHLSRRQGPDNVTRNFIRFLTVACGLQEVRHLVAPKLEMWLMNPKISGAAKDLLQSVTMNCTTHSALDVEVMSTLSKLRLKTKQSVLNLFLACLKDLCTAHPENLPTLLKQTIFNELSSARNPNNMPMLGVMFQADPEKAAAALAGVFIELLLQKDCYLRALRILLREIVRCLRHELNMVQFCLSLLACRDKSELLKDFEYKERMFTSLVDLITLGIFLSITPAVREGFNAFSRGEKNKDMTAYKAFLQSVSTIIKNATWWLYEVVPKLYKPDALVYKAMLSKVLFITPTVDEYCRLDNWPLENERALFFKITSEVPVHEDTILRIFFIGLSKNLPVNGHDSLAIAETLINRAATLYPLVTKDFEVLQCRKANDFMDCVWKLVVYSYPESISLPQDYHPPSMAIVASYWRAWQLLLVMSAHNPLHFGAVGHERYPTLRGMIEMCITSQFVFPPPTLAEPNQLEEMAAADLQLAQIEKQQILEFETQLAAASSKEVITEQNSHLLATLITMDPQGPLRRPPPPFLDGLKSLNAQLKIGNMLYRSRQPDFLLGILQRQGSNQAMPWLADLVESNEGSFSVLPVQCLCEFLLNDSLSGGIESDMMAGGKKTKVKELLLHLQSLLQSPNSDPASCLETMEYFLRRLASVQSSARLQALTGLRLLLTPLNIPEEEMATSSPESDWLLRYLPALPCFNRVYPSVASSLRQACQVDCDPSTVSLYIRFLSQTCPTHSLSILSELSLDLATVIVERASLLPALLPGTGGSHLAAIPPDVQQKTYQALLHVFGRYMLMARQQVSELGWSEAQDMINVLWATRETATLHILVVHAQIILLTYGSAHSNSEMFNNLLLMWFPPGVELPRAYLVDTGDEALLIPDWLKLKMIRSSVSVLVDSALRDLEPQQLVLFIQSFGIPVESMSKLLQTLDQAVQSDLDGVAESVLDKSYMGQLVAVQHKRGATGGLIFANALGLTLSEPGINGDKMAASAGNPPALPALVCPPRSTALIPPQQVKQTLLHLFDVGSPSRMSYKEKQDTFRTLQKLLAQEASGQRSKSMLEATVSALHNILQSDLGMEFLTSLGQRLSFSCVLIRLLSGAFMKPRLSSSPFGQLLLTVSKLIVLRLSNGGDANDPNILKKRKPLITLLQQYINRIEGTPRSNLNGAGSAHSTGSPAAQGRADLHKRSNGHANTSRSSKPSRLDLSSSSLEADLRGLAAEALKREDKRQELVINMTELLIDTDNKNTNKEKYCDGLLVDWLEMLDPGVVSSCPDLQAQLIFARQKRREKKIRSQEGIVIKQDPAREALPTTQEAGARPYLLSLLTHQASWDVLRATVNSVLSFSMRNEKDRHRPPLDPAGVLDFVTACVHIPRLWQGRDQRPAKHQLPADLLHLNKNNLESLAEYVLSEAVEGGGEEAVRTRTSLILRCISQDDKWITFIDYLMDQQQVDKRIQGGSLSTSVAKRRKKFAGFILLQIYLKVPGYLHGRVERLPDTVSKEKTDCIVDSISYTLLCALSASQPGRQWGLKMQEFEVCARKLLSSHPQLFLRSLPLLATGLQGRTQYEFVIFRSRNHLTLYSIAMGLLELARPTIFAECYASSLEAVLTCYSDMCSAYFARRESFYGAIDRFVEFVISWEQAGGQATTAAVNFIHKHADILLRLASAPGTSRMGSLKTLMSTVSFHAGTAGADNQSPSKDDADSSVIVDGSSTNNQDVSPMDIDDDDDYGIKEDIKKLQDSEFKLKEDNIATFSRAGDPTLGASVPSSSTPSMSEDLSMLIRNIQTASAGEELTILLQNLLSHSMQRPGVLVHAQEEILSAVTHPVHTVRTQAYSCLLRLLRHDPKRWSAVLPIYLAALEMKEDGVCESALRNLAEMTVICQDRAEVILTTVFRLGLYQNLAIGEAMTDTLALLNLQIGN